MSIAPKSEDPRQKDGISQGFGQSFRDAAPYLTLGIQLAAAVMLFFLIGWWLDSQFETTPLFMLIGIGIGFAGGMIKFLKSVAELIKKT